MELSFEAGLVMVTAAEVAGARGGGLFPPRVSLASVAVGMAECCQLIANGRMFFSWSGPAADIALYVLCIAFCFFCKRTFGVSMSWLLRGMVPCSF